MFLSRGQEPVRSAYDIERIGSRNSYSVEDQTSILAVFGTGARVLTLTLADENVRRVTFLAIAEYYRQSYEKLFHKSIVILSK